MKLSGSEFLALPRTRFIHFPFSLTRSATQKTDSRVFVVVTVGETVAGCNHHNYNTLLLLHVPLSTTLQLTINVVISNNNMGYNFTGIKATQQLVRNHAVAPALV